MCGIVGGLNVDVTSALQRIAHRGPDGQGVEAIEVQVRERRERMFFGHARLAIQDLSEAGRQPMRSRDGRWWLVFNGEIYNHMDLRKELTNDFRGHSDTETLLELIAAFGIGPTLRRLNGMFAFAALDCVAGKVYLARDPFGIKPCYFTSEERQFAFASEVEAIFAMGFQRSMDRFAVQELLTLRFNPAPGTMWQGIRKVRPGHVVTYDFGTNVVSEASFIDSGVSPTEITPPDALAAYKCELRSAVERQLISDVPVGLLLSGGIDSALVGAMAKDIGVILPSYSVGFGSSFKDCELNDAAETARVLGLPHTAVLVTPTQLLADLEKIAAAVEEPLGTTSSLPLWALAKRARQDVPVVLTGQGTDEPWGGYRKYQLDVVRPWIPGGITRRLANELFGSRLPGDSEVGRALRSLAQPNRSREILCASALFSEREMQLLTDSGPPPRTLALIEDWLELVAATKGVSPVEQAMRIDSRMSLADDLLLYGDRVSMAFGLEARVPMLDLSLVKLVESFPIRYRIRWGRSKILHKKLAESYLPAEIVHRPKRGFQLPFDVWSRGPWRKYIADKLMDNLTDILCRAEVEKLWKEHAEGRRNRSRQIFTLLMLALWRERNESTA